MGNLPFKRDSPMSLEISLEIPLKPWICVSRMWRYGRKQSELWEKWPMQVEFWWRREKTGDSGAGSTIRTLLHGKINPKD